MRALAGALALLSLVPLCAPAAADWLQDGADAARSGISRDVGPAWSDVALDVQLPGMPLERAFGVHVAPIVVDDVAYALVATQETSTLGSCSESIAAFDLFAVPLDGTPHEALGRFESAECGGVSLASDGDRLFVAAHERIAAYDIAERAWVWDVENAARSPASEGAPGVGSSEPGPHSNQRCDALAVDAGRVVAACYWRPGSASFVLFVSAFNATTGERVMEPLVFDEPPDTEPSPSIDDPFPRVPYDALIEGSYSAMIAGMAVANDVAVVVVSRHEDTFGAVDPRPQLRWSRVWALDLASGADLWSRQIHNGLGAADDRGVVLPDAAPPLIVGDAVYLKAVRLARAALVDGSGWTESQDLRGEIEYDGDPGAACAVVGEDLACGFASRAYRLAPDFTVRWQSVLPAGDRFAAGSIAATPERIYAITEQDSREWSVEAQSGSRVVALDAHTGEILWSHTLPERGYTGRLAVHGMAAVALQPMGRLTVIGQTAASPVLNVAVPSTYPAEGALVEVRLSASGGLGVPTEYRADWGDGEVTPWQSEPVFAHRYGETVDRVARFTMRNDANQTASVPVTFFVGQADPSVNLFNAPFSAEYQETSFFLLGLFVTGLAALFGILRAGRRRRLLDRELRALEADYQRLEPEPKACADMLAQRKARARALFLQRKLEEAHASFLTARIDEMRRGLRLGAIDHQLKFLPHGMVLRLQRLLADAHVDEYEREHFVAALDLEETLTPQQKAHATRLIDSWFVQDAGGAGRSR